MNTRNTKDFNLIKVYVVQTLSVRAFNTEDFKNENIIALSEAPSDAVEVEHELHEHNTTQHIAQRESCKQLVSQCSLFFSQRLH